ncbi:hypothetical protein J3R03_002559 [Actinoplanes couchii]|nr:hypothetical protein [Actinoplanes couchii]
MTAITPTNEPVVEDLPNLLAGAGMRWSDPAATGTTGRAQVRRHDG